MGWRFFNDFPILRYGILAINRENFLHVKCRNRCFLAYWVGLWRNGMPVDTFIHLVVHLYISSLLSNILSLYPYQTA